MHWPATPREITRKRRNRITIPGVYVWYSPRAQHALRSVFLASTKIVLKIGSSGDVLSRNLEARGENSERSTDPRYGFDPLPYAGVTDWTLFRYTTQLNGLSLEDREKELQLQHEPLACQTWAAIYFQLTGSRHPPRQQEIYLTKIDANLEADFPIRHPIDHADFVLAAEQAMR